MKSIRFLTTRILYLSLVLLVGFIGLLMFVQHGMIYHPRPYKTGDLGRFTQVVDIPYSTSQGAQQGYYVPPRSKASGQEPSKIWVIFSGNGSRALDWMSTRFVQSYPSAEDAFLLMDYPGYGACAGRPSPKSIAESADALLVALSARLDTPIESLQARLGVLGHSLGAAAALAFADAHPVSDVVLIAPFTSLLDMAKLRVGWPLCYLLMDHFDNRERLHNITQRASVPRITILFGKDDESIPFSMGQELARLFPKVQFQPQEDVGHVTILTLAQNRIYKAMLNQAMMKAEG